MNALALIAVSVGLCAFMRFADKKIGMPGLIALSAMCMVRLSVTAGIPIDIGGLKSNFGCLLYAPVIFATALCHCRYGPHSAWRQVRAVFGAVAVGAVVIEAAKGFAGPSANRDALVVLLDVSWRVIGASFGAFLVANIACLGMLRSGRGPVLAQIVAQAFDSIVFFPLAFYGVPGFPLIETMLAGFAIKSGIALLAAPLMWGVKREEAATNHLLKTATVQFNRLLSQP